MNRVCMVVYAYYPADPRVRKEAETLVRSGYEVDVVCLRRNGEANLERVNGVRVVRLPLSSARRGGKLRYTYQYVMFFLLAAYTVMTQHRKKGYSVIHAHSVPDFIVFTAVYPKLTGAKVILDLHEGIPEIYLSRHRAERRGMLCDLLLLLERLSSWYADRVITVSDYLAEVFINRGMDKNKITVLYNIPLPLNRAEAKLPKIASNKQSLVFAGNLNEYNDFDTVLDGLEKINGVELHIYGDGVLREHIEQRCAGTGGRVRLHGWQDSETVADLLGGFGAGLVAFSDTPITRVALGNKVFEYTAAGLPVVAPRLPALESVFDDSCLFYYKPGDAESFAEALRNALSEGACDKVANAQRIIAERRITWQEMERRLLSLYESLVPKRF